MKATCFGITSVQAGPIVEHTFPMLEQCWKACRSANGEAAQPGAFEAFGLKDFVLVSIGFDGSFRI